jgi:hypothetical protein
MKVHAHLVEISHLARQCYDESITHRSRYEQAYTAEQVKLAQSVTACRALEVENERLSRENHYYQMQLVSDYERLISLLRHENADCEARRRALEEKNCKDREEHRLATDAMIELLAVSNERLEALEAGLQQGTTPIAPVSARLRPRNRFIQRSAAATSEDSEPARRRSRAKE